MYELNATYTTYISLIEITVCLSTVTQAALYLHEVHTLSTLCVLRYCMSEKVVHPHRNSSLFQISSTLKYDSFLTMIGKRMEEASKLLSNHNSDKQIVWISVKRCTRRSGTCRRYIKSGWYFIGMKRMDNRSTNCREANQQASNGCSLHRLTWRPRSAETPISRNTPYNTGIGIFCNRWPVSAPPNSSSIFTTGCTCAAIISHYHAKGSLLAGAVILPHISMAKSLLISKMRKLPYL